MKASVGHRSACGSAARLRAAGVGASLLVHAGVGWTLLAGPNMSADTVRVPIDVRFVEMASPVPPSMRPAESRRVVSPARIDTPAQSTTKRAQAAAKSLPRPPVPRKSMRTASPQHAPAQASRPPAEATRAAAPAPAGASAPWTDSTTAGEPTAPPRSPPDVDESLPPARQTLAGSGASIPGENGAPMETAATAAAPASQPITPPRSQAAYLRNPSPTYPPMSRRLGEQGRVVLRVFVERDGRPTQVGLRMSSGSSRLDAAALDAVRAWTFVPAQRGDESVSAWVLVPVQFRLDNG